MEFNIRLRAKGGKILLVPYVSCNYLARTEIRRVIPYYFSNGFWAVFPLKFGVLAVKLRHMVPSFFVPMLAFPVTSAGKIDRFSLPRPSDHSRTPSPDRSARRETTTRTDGEAQVPICIERYEWAWESQGLFPGGGATRLREHSMIDIMST